MNVTDSAIELSGTVSTGKEKQTAERIAQSYAGNRKVVDRITVTGKGNESPSGQATPVQLILNGLAPTGGVQIGLNSNSNALLMPNGTRSQLFTVPAGQSSMIVALNAQTVSSNTTVTLLGISNGIRRTSAVIVMP